MAGPAASRCRPDRPPDRTETTPLDTLGSSIGSFRHACFAQATRSAALARFETGYVEQAYDGDGSPSPSRSISAESDRILGLLLGEEGAGEICNHPLVKTHIVAARLQNDRGLDRGLPLPAPTGDAALGTRSLGEP